MSTDASFRRRTRPTPSVFPASSWRSGPTVRSATPPRHHRGNRRTRHRASQSDRRDEARRRDLTLRMDIASRRRGRRPRRGARRRSRLSSAARAVSRDRPWGRAKPGLHRAARGRDVPAVRMQPRRRTGAGLQTRPTWHRSLKTRRYRSLPALGQLLLKRSAWSPHLDQLAHVVGNRCLDLYRCRVNG